MVDWIEWNGGANPVPGKNAAVIYRDGHIQGDTFSELLNWSHTGRSTDIVRYIASEVK